MKHAIDGGKSWKAIDFYIFLEFDGKIEEHTLEIAGRFKMVLQWIIISKLP